jgi:hypothetical protein
MLLNALNSATDCKSYAASEYREMDYFRVADYSGVIDSDEIGLFRISCPLQSYSPARS